MAKRLSGNNARWEVEVCAIRYDKRNDRAVLQMEKAEDE
jgi:hypothetical protein